MVAALKRRREAKGMTRRGVSALMGVSSGVVSRLESNPDCRVEMDTILRYAWAVDAEVVLRDFEPDA